MLDQRELVAEGYLVLVAVLHGEAQEIAESCEHRVGSVDVAVHQRRDRVQRVEEKVGMDLRAKRLQLRLGQSRAQIRRCHLPLAVSAVELEGVDYSYHRPERHRLVREIARELIADGGAEVEPKRVLDRDQHRVLDHHAHRCHNQRQRKHHAPAFLVDWITPAHPEKERREQRAGVPVGEARGEHFPPGDRLAALR